MEKSKNNQPKTSSGKTSLSESRDIAKPPAYKIATPPPKKK